MIPIRLPPARLHADSWGNRSEHEPRRRRPSPRPDRVGRPTTGTRGGLRVMRGRWGNVPGDSPGTIGTKNNRCGRRSPGRTLPTPRGLRAGHRARRACPTRPLRCHRGPGLPRRGRAARRGPPVLVEPWREDPVMSDAEAAEQPARRPMAQGSVATPWPPAPLMLKPRRRRSTPRRTRRVTRRRAPAERPRRRTRSGSPSGPSSPEGRSGHRCGSRCGSSPAPGSARRCRG